MSPISVRPFRRSDRDQLTALVNAHVRAVVPGVSVSVNAVLSQLEREPDEVVVDPWVVERTTLVAEQAGAVVAAAHVLRYGAGPEVAEAYRDGGELRWLVHHPHDHHDGAGDAVVTAAVRHLVRSGARRVHAGGALPAPGVYGVPEVWPHVAATLRRAGFRPGDRTETVLLAEVDSLPRPMAPRPGLTVRRTVGRIGTRFTASLDDGAGPTEAGLIEVSDALGDHRRAPAGGWAEIGDLWVREDRRRDGIGTWLLGQAAEWLALGQVTRLLDYAAPDEDGYAEFLHAAGFVVLARTVTCWELAVPRPT